MGKEEKNTLIANVIRFFVGIFLLLFCVAYLQKNPAEKIALYSGFQIIFQKVEVFGWNILGKNGNLVEEKYKLESDFLEIIHLAEEKGCYNDAFLRELHETYENLSHEEKNNISDYLPDYKVKMYNYYDSLSKKCEN